VLLDPTVVADPAFASDSLRVVRRDGDVVVRRTGWWSPAVQALLVHLEAVGFAASPRFVGLDADGHERLGYIDGTSGMAAWRMVGADEGLRSYARLLRGYHDAVRGYEPARDAEWMLGRRALAPGELVVHGDVGPWNTVWRDGEAVGLLDWDQAAPRPAIHDVAYALEYAVPFRSDEDAAAQIGFSTPIDRAARLRVFAEAYGLASTEGLVDAVIAEQEETLRVTLDVARRGLQPHAAWVAGGFAEAQRARIAWTRTHRHLLG
jgi:hypothetical protein